jgi:Kef-type K+ transport system membrane component KefB
MVLNGYLYFLIYLSITLLAGFVFGKLVELAKIPEITGYIIAGVFLGPSIFNIINVEALQSFDVITNFVLGIIAYQIGTELWMPKVKKSGKSIITITAVQAIATAAIVFLFIYLIDGRLWLALTLSAIATATAPAPIMVIIKKLKAKGPVTDTVVPVVGIDDMFGVIIFGLFTSIAVATIGSEGLSVKTALIDPLVEVLLSVGIGSAFGLLLGFVSKIFIHKLPKRDKYIAYLVFSLSSVLFAVYISHTYHLSMILTPMMIGMVFTNFIKKDTFKIHGAALSNFSGPLIIVFFTLAGAQLSLSVLKSAGLIAVLYIVLRTIGKIGGAYVGASIAKSPKVVKNATGFCLLPQGGVEIGMLVAVSSIFPSEQAIFIKTVVLAGILFFEIVGPIMFKYTLERVGESREKENATLKEVKKLEEATSS